MDEGGSLDTSWWETVLICLKKAIGVGEWIKDGGAIVGGELVHLALMDINQWIQVTGILNREGWWEKGVDSRCTWERGGMRRERVLHNSGEQHI